MTDTGWTIDGTKTEGLLDSHPVITRGETAGFSFVIYPPPRGDPDHLTRYKDLRAYLYYADQAAYGTDIEGVPYFKEQHTWTDSLVVDLNPGPDSVASKGAWGLIVGGDDETNQPSEQCILSLDVFILAELSDYSDKDAVRSDL